MKSNSRILRGWKDFGVKATAVILTMLLATQMVGTPAFAAGATSAKQANEDIATTVDDTGVDGAADTETTDGTEDPTNTGSATDTQSGTDPETEAPGTSGGENVDGGGVWRFERPDSDGC